MGVFKQQQFRLWANSGRGLRSSHQEVTKTAPWSPTMDTLHVSDACWPKPRPWWHI